MTAVSRRAIIMDLLFTRAGEMATNSPMLPVSLPEPTRTFDPPTDGKYLAVKFLPNTPAWEGLADGKIDQGILQVEVVWPKGQGQIAPVNIAGAVAAWFPKGLKLYRAGVRVKVSTEPVDAAPLTDPDKLRIPVSIYWTAS